MLLSQLSPANKKLLIINPLKLFQHHFALRTLIKLLFPKAPAGGEILKISSFSILFITIEQIANVTLQGLGKTIKPVISITIGIIAKTILNLLLVSRYDFILGGTKGAAFSTIVCHFIVSFISLVQLNRYFKRKKEKKEGF